MAQAFTRARALSEQLAGTPQLAAVLGGLRAVYEVRGELPKAREVAEQMLGLAQREQEPARLMRAYMPWGRRCSTWEHSPQRKRTWNRGWPWIIPHETAQGPCAARAISRAAASGGQLPALCCLYSLVPGLSRAGPAAEPGGHRAGPEAGTSLYPGLCAHLRQSCTGSVAKHQAAQARAEEVIALARQQEFPVMVMRGTVPRGWALAVRGQRAEGITQMRQGMDAEGMIGRVQRPYRLALLAEVCGQIGQTQEARRLLTEALALTQQYGGHFYEAEVHRLTGEILLMQHAGRDVFENPPPACSMSDGHPGETADPWLRHTGRKPTFARPLTSLAGSRPSPWSCGRR